LDLNLGGAVSRPASQRAAVVPAGDVSPTTSATATATAPSTAARDPISEAPSALWYVRISDGNQFGPAPGDMMRRWLEEGRVTADSLVWREGWAEWGVAGRLFPQLSRPAQPADIGASAFTAFEEGLAAHVESLVVPAAADVATDADEFPVESKPIRTSTLTARRKAKQRSKFALIALVVAVLLLVPVFFIVLLKQ
jgi:hypothetical protein